MSGGSCLNNLYPLGTLWVGTTQNGTPKQFKNLDMYRQYIVQTGCPDVYTRRTVAPTQKPENTPFTGFMEFKPKDPNQQSLYSAMSPYWVGYEQEKGLPSSAVSR
jgi:hypothetical protein